MKQLDNTVKRCNKVILSELDGINCWIAGGSLRDYFMGEPIKTDWDIFFPNEDEFNKAKEHFENKKAKSLWKSKNAIKFTYNNRTFDLIKRYFPTPIDTIKAFDFTVSMFAVDKNKVYHGETSFIDLAKRQLMINKITYPASTLSRAFRYYEKGFKMCKGEMLKLISAIKSMEPETQQNEQELYQLFTGID